MRTLRATTLAGTDIQLDSAAVTAFKGRLHGALLGPEDPPYAQARKVWNGFCRNFYLRRFEVSSSSLSNRAS